MVVSDRVAVLTPGVAHTSARASHLLRARHLDHRADDRRSRPSRCSLGRVPCHHEGSCSGDPARATPLRYAVACPRALSRGSSPCRESLGHRRPSDASCPCRPCPAWGVVAAMGPRRSSLGEARAWPWRSRCDPSSLRKMCRLCHEVAPRSRHRSLRPRSSTRQSRRGRCPDRRLEPRSLEDPEYERRSMSWLTHS